MLLYCVHGVTTESEKETKHATHNVASSKIHVVISPFFSWQKKNKTKTARALQATDRQGWCFCRVSRKTRGSPLCRNDPPTDKAPRPCGKLSRSLQASFPRCFGIGIERDERQSKEECAS